MKLTRSSGILLHPSSFPGPDGIGDLGPQAYYWINFLKSSGCSLWQTLPLGPTGFGDSPYQCFSAFAGNPLFVSPAILLDNELLTVDDLADRPRFPDHGIDYGNAIIWKTTLLDRAYAAFCKTSGDLKEMFSQFCKENRFWLDDYSLFMAIKETQDGICWTSWSKELRRRDESALAAFRAEHITLIEKHQFRQFLFFSQWNNLKKYANENGISIIGDIPIFVSMDSADVWSHPDLFYLDDMGNPTVVAGVPPDYFSPTGQLWGNPIYRWSEHQKEGFTWWIERVRATLKLCDLIRLDHFRGFCGYWEVPAQNKTAEIGRWVEAPGRAFLATLQEALHGLPLIAEDLGEISQDVVDLRDAYNLPGMKILQFGFSDDARNLFLPHNYVQNCIAYSGTHDNDTAKGWYETATDKEKDFARRYFESDGSEISWDMIKAIWSSVAVYSIAPLQDFLSLGNNARMNFPGRAQGNWGYRYKASDLTPDLAFRILDMNKAYNRIAELSAQPIERPYIRYEKNQ